MDERPSCFGKLWDPKTTECSGGLDPAYRAADGTQVRERCDFFGPCASRTQSARLLEQQQQNAERVHLPISQPIPQPSFRPPPQPISQPIMQQQSLVPQISQQQMQQIVASVVAQLRAQGAAGVAPSQHQQMMPVNYQMPSYLSVPEEWGPGDNILTVGGKTIIRSMLKGGAQGLAHLMDSTPFKLW